MKVQVKLFARARELANSDVVEVELPADGTVGQLRAVLTERYAALRPMVRSLLFAVGNEYADDAAVIPPNGEVACFPPVSGG
ncbi:MAG: MoaD/ThiS family protein [Planctomycetes bacterium]|nr:MoaD/ThiS family protein [Planctomycetota bacterium]